MISPHAPAEWLATALRTIADTRRDPRFVQYRPALERAQTLILTIERDDLSRVYLTLETAGEVSIYWSHQDRVLRYRILPGATVAVRSNAHGSRAPRVLGPNGVEHIRRDLEWLKPETHPETVRQTLISEHGWSY